MRIMGSSGIEVAPLALGDNVFGWTTDVTASFAVLGAFDALVKAGRVCAIGVRRVSPRSSSSPGPAP